MDLSFFSANPQSLNLVSCIPLSSASFCSFRRELLGSERQPRSPAGSLRARRASNKLGFLQIRSRPFRFRAALISHSVLVVGAVVTFSAISVVYFNHYQKRKKNGKEVSGLHNFSLSHLGRDLLGRVIRIWILGLGDLHKENSVKVSKAPRDTTRTNSSISKNKVAPVHVNISTAVNEETHVTKTEGSSDSDSRPCGANDSVFSNSTAMHEDTHVNKTEESSGYNSCLSSANGSLFSNSRVDSVDSNVIPSSATLVHKETLITKTVDSVDSNVIPSSASLVHEETLVSKTVDPASSYVILSTSTDSIFSDSTLMHEETLITKTADSAGSDDSDSIFSNESQVTDSSFSPVTSDSGALEHLTFPVEMSKFQQEECRDDNKFKNELEKLMSESNCTVLNNGLVEGAKNNKTKVEVAGKIDTTSYSGLHKEYIRAELYTFYEAKQPVTKSTENLNGLKSASSHAFLEGNGFSSVVRNTLIEGTELSTQDSLPIAEVINGKIPRAYLNESSPYQRRESKRSRGSPRGKERREMDDDTIRSFQQSFHPNRMHVNGKDDPSEKSSTYDRLLRNGKVTECVELLEGLERTGSLDMSKIYHARFFQACKNQKAVGEAFRFTKLISNPTLSTFNMLMSVCANSQDSSGAFRVLQLVQEAGLKADCKLHTTLISSCGRSGKVDAMFEVFHKMVNAGVEPNIHTYGALIDGCAKAGQVAKAFGAYGIMRSKNVKPDRVVFNALITACGQSGAVDRAFDVLAEMSTDEAHPIEPDHVTIGALIKACANAGQIDRAREVYKMIHKYNIKGTPEVYTIAVNCCSHTGDWEFACSVYDEMKKKGIVPDEMFLSALVDAAGHAGKVEAAFEILQEARKQGIHLGIISYSSLMGSCSNAKNWQKALELYEYIKSIKLKPTVSTMNALITALCGGDQLEKAMNVMSEMKRYKLRPNNITYSMLLLASEKKDDLDSGLVLFSQAKEDGISPNFVMCRRIVGMCLRRFEKAYGLGEPVVSFKSGRPQIENKWTSLALSAYRKTVATGAMPTMEVVSLVLGCLQLPCDSSLKNRMIEDLGLDADTSRYHKLYSLIDGFGEYDPCAMSLFEEAASQGIVPSASFKGNPIIVDARKLEIHTAKVYLLTVLKGLKHRLAAGARLPNLTILLPMEKRKVVTPGGEKMINVAGRISLAVAALLRRLALPYQGNGSSGKIKISGLCLRRWLQPKLTSPLSGKPVELIASQSRLRQGIVDQQRDIRSGYLSWE